MPEKGNRWAALSMRDRAALIKMFLGSGVSRLSDMRSIYNEDIDHAPSSDKNFNIKAEGGSLGDPPEDYPFLEGALWNPPSYRGKNVPIPMKPYETAGPIDEVEIARRQRYVESTFNDRAINKRTGAAGAYQIMPVTQKQFKKRKKRKGDILDYKYNKEVRDYMMDWLSERPYLQAPTDSVAMGKQLAAYNYGSGNVKKKLEKAKSEGVDINDSWDWLSYMPEETRNYVNFILRNKDIRGKTNEDYKKRVKNVK